MTTLGEYAEINPPPRDLDRTSDELVTFVPMAAVSEDGRLVAPQTRRIADVARGYTYFERNDVLLAKITPCMENGKAALLDALEPARGFGSTEFHVLRPRAGVDPRFLFYLVWNRAFREQAAKHMTGTAGQKRVPGGYVRSAPVPLLDATEQRRVADILDKADSIRSKRKKAIDVIEELLGSAFSDLVGPAAAHYSEWPFRTIESLAARVPNAIRTGPFGSDLLHSEFVEEGIAVLGIDNAVQNRFAWGERRFITAEKYERLRRYTVLPDDVIVTIMGTTGRSAVVPADIPVAITTKHLATITVDRNEAEPEFVSQALFRHSEALRQIAAANRGAIMSGLNLRLIKALRLPIPPRERQREFARVTTRVRSLASRMAERRHEEELFDSLVARAFSGQLGSRGSLC